MDKKHTLVGEDFFRTMMRLGEERRRYFVRGDLGGNRSGASNVVSFECYRREQQLKRAGSVDTATPKGSYEPVA